MATTAQMRKHVINQVRSILVARRNGNIRVEQELTESLIAYCRKYNLDYTATFDGAHRILKKSIANQMNGFI